MWKGIKYDIITRSSAKGFINVILRNGMWIYIYIYNFFKLKKSSRCRNIFKLKGRNKKKNKRKIITINKKNPSLRMLSKLQNLWLRSLES